MCKVLLQSIVAGMFVIASASAPSASALKADNSMQILTRGPVHEAFLTATMAEPAEPLVVETPPPEPINEIPPDRRPDQRGVMWLPGYWYWDADADTHIWVSGVWRVPPPGQRWVPGYWHEHEKDKGWQWSSGMWVAADAEELAYYPPPPASQERGPNSPPPSGEHFWVPGRWEYSDNEYRWRAGHWAAPQDNWIWTPEHYRWSPRGMVRVGGYWDLPVAGRGMLFANAGPQSGVAAASAAEFQPVHAIPAARLMMHLFVQGDQGQYYYGDYYDDQYREGGYQPWYAWYEAQRGYEPTFAWYSRYYGQQGTDYAQLAAQWYEFFRNHPGRRPPRTWDAQAAFAAENQQWAQLDQALLALPLNEWQAGSNGSALVNVSARDREVMAQVATQLRALSGDRLQLESLGAAALGLNNSGGNAAATTTTTLRLPKPIGLLPSGTGRGGLGGQLLPGQQRPGAGRQIELPRVPQTPRVPQAPRVPQVPGLPGLLN